MPDTATKAACQHADAGTGTPLLHPMTAVAGGAPGAKCTKTVMTEVRVAADHHDRLPLGTRRHDDGALLCTWRISVTMRAARALGECSSIRMRSSSRWKAST